METPILRRGKWVVWIDGEQKKFATEDEALAAMIAEKDEHTEEWEKSFGKEETGTSDFLEDSSE